MADTVEGKIADLLLTRVGTLPISPALDVSYPGLNFSPPAGETYLEAMLLPNVTVTRTVNEGGSNKHQGILQITVCHPIGQGAIPAMEIAGQVIEHFTRGTSMVDGDVAVRIIRQPWAAPPLTEPDRIRVPVSIPFVCFAAAT